MDYAMINNGIVINVIWLDPKNAADFPGAVPMNDIPARIGDEFKNGKFYRNGDPVLTAAEEALSTLEAAAQAYREGVAEA